MKLSRTVEYAIQAMVQLAEFGRAAPIPCSRLASEGRMPERFLLQILRNLVTHGILTSTRGVDGGYALGRGPEQISLLDVIEAIDGPIGGASGSSKAMPADLQQRLNSALNDVTARVRRDLSNVKLSHLVSVRAGERA